MKRFEIFREYQNVTQRQELSFQKNGTDRINTNLQFVKKKKKERKKKAVSVKCNKAQSNKMCLCDKYWVAYSSGRKEREKERFKIAFSGSRSRHKVSTHL